MAGIVLGFAMSSGSEQDARMTAQMDEMQAGLARALEDVSVKVDALAGGIQANETAIAALTGTLEDQSTGTAASLEALGAKAEAESAALQELRGALEQLSGDQASLSDTVTGMTGDMDSMRGDLMAAMQETLTAAAAAVGMGGTSPQAPGSAGTGATRTAAAPPDGTEEPAAADTAGAAEPVDDTAEAEALAAAVGDDGMILSIGESAQLGETRIFLSRVSEAGAHLRIRGQDPVTAGIDGAAADVGGGCAVALAGLVGRKAYLTTACADEAAGTGVAQGELPEPVDMALAVGQTGLFGDMRVFLSRLDGGAAHLRIFTLTGMSEEATVGTRQPHVMANGCGVALKGLDGRVAHLHAACGDDAVSLADIATLVAAPAPVPEIEAAPETPETAATEPEADPEPRLADRLSETGLMLKVGQTATVGDARIFVQRLPDNTAQLMQVGQGPLSLDIFRPAELDNGCSLVLLGVQDGAAYVEPSCPE
ncbi:hypothetical protein ATO3_09090 [Marinibacterium profundimaris]|uniref:Uncharacterized protein n=1 Tax=Marinibacterium profundimaris TaxID=1679460 RepID=A0A225NLE4_9RHOB|nr:hypothetical protein ATO3_09090 [Marinibacterium profundimaris]